MIVGPMIVKLMLITFLFLLPVLLPMLFAVISLACGDPALCMHEPGKGLCAFCAKDSEPANSGGPVVASPPDAPLRIDVADEGGPLPIGAADSGEHAPGGCEISEYVVETVDDPRLSRPVYRVDVRATSTDGRVYRVATRDFYFYSSEAEVEAALDRLHPIGDAVACLPEIARPARGDGYE